MKVRVYLNDWFYNAGIVGFLKILAVNEDNFAIKKIIILNLTQMN